MTGWEAVGGCWVAEFVTLDPVHGSQVWVRWTTEDPGRTGPPQLTDPQWRGRLARAPLWQVSYRTRSSMATLEPLVWEP